MGSSNCTQCAAVIARNTQQQLHEIFYGAVITFSAVTKSSLQLPNHYYSCQTIITAAKPLLQLPNHHYSCQTIIAAAKPSLPVLIASFSTILNALSAKPKFADTKNFSWCHPRISWEISPRIFLLGSKLVRPFPAKIGAIGILGEWAWNSFEGYNCAAANYF